MSTAEQKAKAVQWLTGVMDKEPSHSNDAAILLDEIARLRGFEIKTEEPRFVHRLGLPDAAKAALGVDLPFKRHCRVLREYLMVCVERGDWHGVSDAANDLRELEAAYPVLKEKQ